MIFITHVHMVGGAGHEHIASVRWRNRTTDATGESTRAQIVDWIERQESGAARVSLGQNDVRVGVVDATPKHIRTRTGDVWTDVLLELPRY